MRSMVTTMAHTQQSQEQHVAEVVELRRPASRRAAQARQLADAYFEVFNGEETVPGDVLTSLTIAVSALLAEGAE